MKRGILITFGIMVGSGLVVFYLLSAGFYPAAIVNGAVISGRTFEDAVASVDHYYDEMIKEYTNPSSPAPQRPSSADIRTATLDMLVESVIIEKEFSVVVGGSIDDVVNQQIESAKKTNPQFEIAVSTLYGLTLQRFKELILNAQARQEILSQKKPAFTDWLHNARTSARVYILEPGLGWDEGKVMAK